MASTLGLIWARLMHDLTINEHEMTTVELLRRHIDDGVESPEEQEERLHTETAGPPNVEG